MIRFDRTHLFFGAALGCALVAACSGNSDAPGEPDAADGIDTTAPTIVSTSPSNGATGQRSDVVISIVFSEPMDQQSVEATLATADLGDVTFSWNGAGDSISITPDAPLEYAVGIGDDPATVDAEEFTVTLGNAAQDLAGNGLGAGTQITFATLKSISTTYDLNQDLTLSLTATGTASTAGAPLPIGDTAGDAGVRAAITFNMGLLPITTVEVASATLATRQAVGNKVGAPYGDGGDDAGLGDAVLIDHVTYTALDNAAFNSSQVAHAALGTFCVDEQVVIEKDVTSAVDDDRVNRDTRNSRSQFLLRFATETDLDGIADLAFMDRDLFELQVTYLAP